MMYSDTSISDSRRTGDDLLARIDELTQNHGLDFEAEANGWRYLLLACAKEIRILKGFLELYEPNAEALAISHLNSKGLVALEAIEVMQKYKIAPVPRGEVLWTVRNSDGTDPPLWWITGNEHRGEFKCPVEALLRWRSEVALSQRSA